MNYVVVYTKTSKKDIDKLDRVVRKKLKKKIEVFLSSPIRHARKLTDKRIGMYRWRAGSYRIVFDKVGNKIVILRIRHRKEVYK